MTKARFGVFLPSYAFKESQPVNLYRTICDVALECESLGYDSIWLDDHLMYKKSPLLECWSTLAAIAAATKRIRLGTMVTSAAFRNPAVLAKAAATVDAISDGRLEFGIGAGIQGNEHEAYGITFPKPSVRINRMREAIEIIKAMWTQQNVTYKGQHYNTRSAVCEPKPIQKPHPPITIGGCGEKHTLKITARYADKFDFGYLPTIADYEHKLGVLENHCKAIDRNFADIEKSAWPAGQILLSENNFDLQQKINRIKPVGMSKVAFDRFTFSGSPSDFGKIVKPYLEIGVKQFMLFFADLPDAGSLSLLARNLEKIG